MRNEHADGSEGGLYGLLRGDEVVRATKAESDASFCGFCGRHTGCRDDRTGYLCATERTSSGADCRSSSHNAVTGAFTATARALLLVSHLIHGR